MLDFLSSKVGMIFAALVIAGALIGFFTWQKGNFEDIQRKNTADFIANEIDYTSSLSSNHRFLITFDANSKEKGKYLDSMIGGEPYEIIIRQNHVVVKQKGEIQAVSSIAKEVHLWNPRVLRTEGLDVVNNTNLDEIDQGNRSLSITSGQDFYIESYALNVTTPTTPMESIYHTFIYRA